MQYEVLQIAKRFFWTWLFRPTLTVKRFSRSKTVSFITLRAVRTACSETDLILQFNGQCQNLNFSPFGSFQEAVESFAQRPQSSLWAQFAVFVDLLTEVQMGTFNVLATFSWNAVAAVSSFLFTAFTLLVLSRAWTLTGDTPRELKYSERSQWSVSSVNDCLRIDVFISFNIVWLIVTFWSLKHATNNPTTISKLLFPWS